jgi:hypothetical protein
MDAVNHRIVEVLYRLEKLIFLKGTAFRVCVGTTLSKLSPVGTAERIAQDAVLGRDSETNQSRRDG